jgi:signal transduction histidine kinase
VPRLVHLIDSLNPVRGESGRSSLTLRTFRFTCLSAVVLLPAFGWLYHASGEPVVDPWGLRAVGSVGAGALLGLSYVSATVRRHTGPLHQTAIYAMTAYIGWLSHANGLSANYALGYLFVFAALALSHSLAYTRRGPFVRYLLVSTGVALAVAIATVQPGVWPPLFAVSVVVLAVMLYIAVEARMETHRALEVSQAQHTAAETLAGAGSWVVDLIQGGRTWSAGARRLYGIAPDAVLPSMLTLVHPDDRGRATRVNERLARDGGTAELTFRAVTAGGAERTLQSISRAEPGPDGRPARLTGVLLDVTAQVAREADLRDARDRAEAADRAKSDFLANMSHEIRTPLTAIIGFAQLLGEETGEAYRDLVGPIESGGLRLLDTLNSVLDLARMDAGHDTLQLTPVDAGAEVRAVVAMLAPRATGVAVIADIAAGVPRALADRPALSRVLANLVSNAVKFTQAGEVRVSVRPAPDGGVTVTVADTGAGMSADFMATLYEPFRQASTGWGRSHEGTGLGLTITQRLVHAMGGTLSVESAVGRGSVFTLHLAAAPERPTGAPMPAVKGRARAVAPASPPA